MTNTTPGAELIVAVANKAQEALGRGVHPSTAKAIIEAYEAARELPAASLGERNYTLEFAEYMAKGAERVIDAVNAYHIVCDEDCDEVTPDEVSAADQELGDAMTGLRSDIYEFRKRRDRQAPTPSTTGSGHQAWCSAKEGAGCSCGFGAERKEFTHSSTTGSGDAVKLATGVIGSYAEELPASFDALSVKPETEAVDQFGAVNDMVAAKAEGDGGEACESGAPECGPVEHHDVDGVPLCKVCWEGLLSDTTQATQP